MKCTLIGGPKDGVEIEFLDHPPKQISIPFSESKEAVWIDGKSIVEIFEGLLPKIGALVYVRTEEGLYEFDRIVRP